MPTNKPIEVPFPLKGINRNQAANQQPELTSPFAYNVMPYDQVSTTIGIAGNARGERARGGQRPGLSSFIDLGTGVDVMRLIQQAASIDGTIYLENWNYTNLNGLTQNNSGSTDSPAFYPVNGVGEYTGYLKDVTVGGNPVWEVRVSLAASNIINSLVGTIGYTGIVVENDRPTDPFTGSLAFPNMLPNYPDEVAAADDNLANANTDSWTARYVGSTSTIDLSSAVYNFQAKIFIASSSLAYASIITCVNGASKNNLVELQIRAGRFIDLITTDGSGTQTTRATYDYGASFIGGRDPLNPGGSNPVTIEIRRNGDSFQGWVDVYDGNGLVQRVSYTYPTGTSPTAQGFAFGGFGSGQAAFYNVRLYNPSPEPQRISKLIAVSNTNIYIGDNTNMVLATNGTGAIATGIKPGAAAIDQNIYFADGSVGIKVLNILTGIVTNLVASVGSIPQNCRMATNFQGRLVLSGDTNNPQNIYMSRAGDPTDWDYNPASGGDDLQAVALNASSAGHIGSPVRGLAPCRDDKMMIMCDDSIWLMEGNPGAGGSVILVTNADGGMGPDAWCLDGKGHFYFLGTKGLYRMTPHLGFGEIPENISQSILPAFFDTLSRTNTYYTLVYDKYRHGVWILMTAYTSQSGSNLWWDERNEGFFEQAFPNDSNPVSSIVYDGAGQSTQVLFGGHDGRIRFIDQNAMDDNGTPITANVFLGPVYPEGPLNEGRLNELDVVLSDTTTNLSYAVFGLREAQEVFDGATARFQGTWTRPGRQKVIRKNARGSAFFLELFSVSAGTTWSTERIIMLFAGGGGRIHQGIYGSAPQIDRES